MSRYVFTYEVDGECLLYAESTDSEDKMDMVDDLMVVNFSGNGYLKFWKRCKDMILELDESQREGKSSILDTYSGEEKVW